MTKEEVSVFQYNSCFCLSESSIIGGVVIHQFQYNSCFCLSKIKFFYRNNSFFISMQLLFLFIGAVIYVHDRNSCDFNTTLVFVYETWNHGFMRSVRPFRQISDKLPAFYGVLRLLCHLFLGTKIARLPAGPIHYISSMSVILITLSRGSSFSSITSKQ